LNAAVKLAVAPGASVSGTEIPETLTVETEGAKLETVTLAVPEFAKRIVWLDSVPTTTFPKVMDEGVAVSDDDGEVVAVPLRSTTKEESEALLAIEILPDSVPAALGLYVIVRLASCPAPKFVGTANPVTLTPVPDTVIPEIVTLPVPALAN
jgi:hypothetical protein